MSFVAEPISDRVDLRPQVRAHLQGDSDDDEIVPATPTDRLASALGVTPVVVSGAGHFLAEGGVTRLPAVLDALT